MSVARKSPHRNAYQGSVLHYWLKCFACDGTSDSYFPKPPSWIFKHSYFGRRAIFCLPRYTFFMLDIGFIREHQDLIKAAAAKKHLEFDVGALIKIDDERKALLVETEGYRAEMNRASDKIPTMEGAERELLLAEMKKVKEKLSESDKKLDKVKIKYEKLMYDVPNIPDPSVPEGAGDEDNVEVRKWGETREFTENMKDAGTLFEDLDFIDTTRGAKVSGARGYFLKNDAVLLSMALWRFAIDVVMKKGFVPITAPAIVRGRNLYGTGHFPQLQEDVYKINDDEYLAGTAEIGLMGYHADEILLEEDLPKKYVAFSPCYRKEAGSYGKDTKGIYRVHEFFKVEQLVLCASDHQESVKWHEELTANAEALLQAIGLPYHVVVNCGGDIGRAHVKTYDIEVWIPSEKRYRESHSASYYHDFQTRRLNIRYRNKDGEMKFAHSLNNTAIATPRILMAFVEHFQNEDGSITVPEVLRPWVGKDILGK